MTPHLARSEGTRRRLGGTLCCPRGRFHNQLFVESSFDDICRIVGFEPRHIHYATEVVRRTRTPYKMNLVAKPIEPVRPENIRSEQSEQILAALRRGRRMRPVFRVNSG